jgi:hypothetical protein
MEAEMHTLTKGTAYAPLVALLVTGGAACAERDDFTAPTTVAVAAHADDATSIVASVRGSGHVKRPDGTSRIFTLEAAKYVDGRVTGTYSLEMAGPESPVRVRGNITCLVVDGSSAYIGGDVSRFDDNPFPTVPGGMAVEIIDNGEGAGADPDLLSPAFFTETQQEILDYCAAPGPGPVFATEQGNFQVR